MKPFLRVAFGALLVTTLIADVPVAAVDVVANDTTDLYEISGSVILDSTYPESRDAATCTTCHWRIIRTCASGPLEDRRNCTGVACPTAEGIAEVWRADAPALPPVGDPLWTYRGLICLLEPPTATGAIAAGIRDLAVRAVPALQPLAQPRTTLTGLPTLFRSGQPTDLMTAPAVVGGVTVRIRAVPSWTWDFGQGGILTTTDPGAAWPNGRVRHTYPRRGIYRVRVTCTWQAVYEARGITDLPVEGVITQSAWFDLRVREARRFLRKPQGA